VDDILAFGMVIGVVCAVLLLAVLSNRVSDRVGVPAPAFFLVGAALASDLVPSLAPRSIESVQRIVTVALVAILFNGGLDLGWPRFRRNAGAIVWVGVAGTFVTAGALALAAHALFGFDWQPALLIGTALAPTDPAVVFSVLGRREGSGRSGTILEGESGANDPVGIALMVSLLGATGGGWSAVGSGVGHFLLQLGVGAAVGAAGGWAIAKITPRLRLGSSALYAIFVVGLALVLYGAATALEGSGFLAVFVAGILAGDRALPEKRSVVGFAGALAALGEIVAFVVLGLSVDLSSVFTGARVWTALGLAALLILVIRPVLVGLVSAPIRLSRGERWFVLLAGLKGAVPILLGTYVLAESAPRAGEIYDIVFVVVLVSVVVQGGLVPAMTRLFRIPLRVGPETSTDRGSE
jgi:cell volume regulation protein A